MSELKYENKKYLGKVFQKEGTGAKGVWKMYKLTFEKPGSEFNQEIKAFDPLGKGSIQIDVLEEGKEYNIGYIEEDYDHLEHGMIKTKTVRFIADKKAEVTQTPTQTPTQTSTQTSTQQIPEQPTEEIVLSIPETQAYNKVVLLLESSFIDTLKAETECDETRARLIWNKVYIPSMKNCPKRRNKE